MMTHRLRRWPDIGQTLTRCIVFAGPYFRLVINNIFVIQIPNEHLPGLITGIAIRFGNYTDGFI